VDNLKSDVEGLQELALFAGGGGGILGGKLLGWRTVCAVEIEEYARGILVRRQNEGHLEPFPIWSDVCTFDGRPWRGLVDVVSGGFPCQDISSAGRGAGLAGSRSGLWREMARIVGEVRPRFVFVENSPLLVCRGLDVVIADLAAMGYDARWGVVGANNAGAPHVRKRIWILAHTMRTRTVQSRPYDTVEKKSRQWSNFFFRSDDHDKRDHMHKQKFAPLENKTTQRTLQKTRETLQRRQVWESRSDFLRVSNGVAHRLDRIKAAGNGQVPAVVELAWKTLINLD